MANINPCCVPKDPFGSHSNKSSEPLSRTAEEIQEWEKNGCPAVKPCVVVQLPPKVGSRRFEMKTTREIQQPQIVYKKGKVKVPHVFYEEKTCRIPRIKYEAVTEEIPSICYRENYVTYPVVKCVSREIVEPKEICQTLLCQPKPQILSVPNPTDFCCYYGPAQPAYATPCPRYPPPFRSPYPTCIEEENGRGFSGQNEGNFDDEASNIEPENVACMPDGFQ